MDAKKLKQYMLDDQNRILTVLEKVGFHSFHISNNEIRCALPDKTNPTGVMVKLDESLYTALYEIGYSGDIIGAIGKVKGLTFVQTMSYIQTLLGVSGGRNIPMIDPLRELRRLKGQSKTINKDNKKYDESILSQFVLLPYVGLVEEGISPKVLNRFKVGFDPEKNRIIFPHYDWEENDKIVGIKGRTLMNQAEMELTNTPKYWNYIVGYRKLANLYGYNLSKGTISNRKMIILFEGEKSVLKEYTYNHGHGCSVALGGHVISDEQAKFIMSNTSGDTEVVIAFDKDVLTNADEGLKFIAEQAAKFKPFRKVSYVMDETGLLEEKDAPVDQGYKVWNELLERRVTI